MRIRVPFHRLTSRQLADWVRESRTASWGSARRIGTGTREAVKLPNDHGVEAAVRVSHLLRALETFQAFGTEFVSLTEGVDTSTPAGKMVFTVLGAVAELECSLIAERVKAGLRNARAKGKRLGRPRTLTDAARIAALRPQDRSWREICAETGLSKGTAQRAFLQLAQEPTWSHLHKVSWSSVSG
jgi:hypothetical protein